MAMPTSSMSGTLNHAQHSYSGSDMGLDFMELPPQYSATPLYLSACYSMNSLIAQSRPYDCIDSLDMMVAPVANSFRRQVEEMLKLEEASSSKRDVKPLTDEDTVRPLIDKQRFDGLWDVDVSMIQNLTGKSLTLWQSIHTDLNPTLLNSLILLLVLEQRFGTYSSLWYGIVQKARKTISSLLSQDAKNIDTYIERIRGQL